MNKEALAYRRHRRSNVYCWYFSFKHPYRRM